MGTRNLTVVISGGEVKVAQYGKYDGYLEGSGEGILNFIHMINLVEFRKALDFCTFISDEEVEKLRLKYKKCYKDDNYFYNHNPQFAGQTGYKILWEIAKNGRRELNLQNSYDFAGDSLFCEYAYVIDLDSCVLEVYKGLNIEPLTKDDRFFHLDHKRTSLGREVYTYYPVKFAFKVPFAEIAKIDTFTKEHLKACGYEDEDE